MMEGTGDRTVVEGVRLEVTVEIPVKNGLGRRVLGRLFHALVKEANHEGGVGYHLCPQHP